MDWSRISSDIDEEILAEYGLHSAYEKFCGLLTLEDIFTVENTVLAAGECASGFRNRLDTHVFMKALWRNAEDLCERVLSGKFKPKYYRERIITERGKPRVIRSPHFECKVVQKVLCSTVVRLLLEPKMITANYASVRGRGTQKLHEDVLAGLNQVKKLIEHPVIVMTDYRNYFGSIDNDVLENTVYRRYIRDERVVKLIRQFSPEHCGLSLGNELSQVPASFCPSPVDHWVKDRLRLKHYYRYMDDILFIADSRDCFFILNGIRERSRALGLTIPDEKIRIVPYGQPFAYCKNRYLYNDDQGYYYSVINPAIPHRHAVKIRAFGRLVESGELDWDGAFLVHKSVTGVIASHPNTYQTVQRLNELFAEKVRNPETSEKTERMALSAV